MLLSNGLRLGLMLTLAINCAAEEVRTLNYAASSKPGQLAIEATFHLWLPPGVKRIRAVIVHQHGCGEGTERFGDLAVQDLHWRALAAKHDAAYLCPHYRTRGADCSAWYDPRKGSAASLQRALDDFAAQSGHPELASAPWCLWGHSGGGVWASLMLEQYAERIVAVFCRSGAAAGQAGVRKAELSAAAYRVPVLLNPGLLERSNVMAWDNCARFFESLCEQKAPVAFAPDPFSGHGCRNSRLLAIPYFDACLNARLPRNGQILKPVT
jgi:alpha-beta hydrolase superfamily lysophospholipase